MRILRHFLIGLFLTIAGIAALMLIPSKQAVAPMPWEVTVMPDGNSKVFGIHLGTTTYRQAQEQFHEYGKTAIFTQEGMPHTVEAFFNSINLGGLSAKLVLNLKVPASHIDGMVSRAMEARLQPSGAHRYQLNNDDNANLINAPITTITYIPSVKLDAEMVRYRFGNADTIELDSDNPTTEIWIYNELGLAIRMTEGEKTVLEYQLH
ncbi:MAG: lytic murein transglycosylase [Methylophaga sp.]|nr:lytic murein transglycosylase [Methylophaga sp.]